MRMNPAVILGPVLCVALLLTGGLAPGHASDSEAVALLDTLRVTGDSAFVLAPHVRFDAAAVAEQVDGAAQAARDEGYLYAEARVLGLSRRDSSVAITLQLIRGPQVAFRSIVLTGLTRTDASLIRRHLRADTTRVLTASTLREIEMSAEAIPFVVFLPPAVVRPRSGYADADIELAFRERRPVAVEGAGGYVPDGRTGVTWSLDLALVSLFGGGRDIHVHSERRQKGRNLLDILYRQPAFLVGLDTWSAQLSTRDYREDFYEFAVATTYETRLGRHLSASLTLSLKDVDPADSAQGYSRYGCGLAVSRRDLDVPLNPSSGHVLDWRLTYAYRRYHGGFDANAPRSLNETEWFVPVMSPFVGRLAATYAGLTTDEALPPLPELVLLGGPPRLRGYRNEQFAAVRAATVAVEPRYRFDGGHLFVFADAAYVNNRERLGAGVGTREDYHWSYGFGLSLMAPDRAVSLSLGYNPDVAFDEPRLSVQVVSSF